jgi:chemotaxis protein MotB
MVFFILMFALSSIDAAKFAQAAASMNPNASAVSLLQTYTGENIVMEMMGNGIIQFPVPPNSLKPVSMDDPVYGSTDTIEASDYEAMRVALAGAELKAIQDDLMTYFPDNPAIPPQDPNSGENNDNNTGNDATDGFKIEKEDFAIRITLPGSVSFESGRHQLTEAAREALTAIAEVLKQFPDNEINIVGHADNQPLRSTAVYRDNTDLAYFRAREVEKFFIEEGMNELMLKTISRGEREPIASNDTPEGRELNRRVEILIYSTVYTGRVVDQRTISGADVQGINN